MTDTPHPDASRLSLPAAQGELNEANPRRKAERDRPRSGQGEVLSEPVTLPGRANAMRKAQTASEKLLWAQLRDRRLKDWKFRRQVVVGPYIVDFLCHEAKLIVELDDSGHAEAVAYDERRTACLKRSGFRVFRVWNNYVTQWMDAVLAGILAAIDSPHPGAARRSLPASQGG